MLKNKYIKVGGKGELMQYFGGKSKIAKYIVPYLESVRKEINHI